MTGAAITTTFFIWRYDGHEIGAYRTHSQAEAHLRRSMKAGWGEKSMYILDKDGSFLFAGGLATGHTIIPEIRDAVYGLSVVGR